MVVLLLALLASCDSRQEGLTAPAPAMGAASQPAEVAFKMGQKVATRYFEVTLNSARLASSVGDRDAGAGNTFLVLDVTARNTDTEGRQFVEGDVLLALDGRTLKFDQTEPAFGAEYLSNARLNPLTSTTGKIVYKVPDTFSGRAYWMPGRDDKRIEFSASRAPAPVAAQVGQQSIPPQIIEFSSSAQPCFKDATAVEEGTLVGTLDKIPLNGVRSVLYSTTHGTVVADIEHFEFRHYVDANARVALTGVFHNLCHANTPNTSQAICWHLDLSHKATVRVLASDESVSASTAMLPLPPSAGTGSCYRLGMGKE